MDENNIDDKIEISELISKLQQEKLFIDAERSTLELLNDELSLQINNLTKTTWINSQQRMIVNSLVTSAGLRPDQCCRLSNLITNCKIVEAKTIFDSPKLANLGPFLSTLRQHTEQLAQWIVVGEQLFKDSQSFSQFLYSLITGLYGSLLFPEDISYILSLLEHLAKFQFVDNDNPRKILNKGLCAFTKMYSHLHQNLGSAKIFLIASLQHPIIHLVANTSTYLDMDPKKTIERMTSDERSRRFGLPSDRDYHKRVTDFCHSSLKCLSSFVNTFICSVQDNIYCFPVTLAALIKNVIEILSASNTNNKEVYEMSADLIFSLFICPAVVHPEPHGICDIPISEMARHNLMQVAQILQSLAIASCTSMLSGSGPKWRIESIEDTFMGVDNISTIIENVLNRSECISDDIVLDKVNGVQRSAVLFMENEIYDLHCSIYIAKFGRLKLLVGVGISIFEKLNSKFYEQYCKFLEAAQAIVGTNNPIPNNLNEEKSSQLVNIICELSEEISKSDIASSANMVVGVQSLSPNKSLLSCSNDVEQLQIKVILIPLVVDREYIGLLPVSKIDIGTNDYASREKKLDHIDQPLDTSQACVVNTSDNFEAVSEAASNHSVASSIELENEDQNDNLSDMVSANVSGRGSPNISGRDTPSSLMIDNEDAARPITEPRQVFNNNHQQDNVKQIRSDIDDKFCKFEIRKLIERDETISILSDTWSTDVLASDTETVDVNENKHFSPIAEDQRLTIREDNVSFVEVHEHNIGESNLLLDISETQSESAWSVDVLASSDTDRLTEVDVDEQQPCIVQSDLNAKHADTSNTVCSLDGKMSTISISDLSGESHKRLHPMSHPYHDSRHRELHFDSCLPKVHDDIRTANDNTSTSAPNNPIKCDSYSQLSNTSLNSSMSSGGASSSGSSSTRNSAAAKENMEIRIEGDSTKNVDANSSKSGSDRYLKQTYPFNTELKSTHLENPDKCKTWEQIDGQVHFLSSNKEVSIFMDSNEIHIPVSKENLANHALTTNKIKRESAISTTTSSILHTINDKLSSATGAIPKSISFDVSTDRGQKKNSDNNEHRHRRTIFGKFRVNLRQRRGKSGTVANHLGAADFSPSTKLTSSGSVIQTGNSIAPEDILAKYRRHNSADLDDISPDLKQNKSKRNSISFEVNRNDTQLFEATKTNTDRQSLFEDARKKLKIVLSNSKTICMNNDGTKDPKKNFESFLQTEMAKAKHLKQWSIAARISETLRTIKQLNIDEVCRLYHVLSSEYSQRQGYTQYLLRSRQLLLSSQSFLKELSEQAMRESEVCNSFLISTCVCFYLNRYKSNFFAFVDNFKSPSLVDEKNDLLTKFLETIYFKIRKDFIWEESYISQCELSIDRYVMGEIYEYALYPNGDGDRHRDSLLKEHLSKLCISITPDHKDLLIDKLYQNECPWLPAQEALLAMAAYKTPRDKVLCIVRCAVAIMDMLSLAHVHGSTTADDFIPVLVFVIIQANPQDLMSTIQYVKSFYGQSLEGEEEYWWTQFCSAVEFTKTMDYK